MPLRLIGTIILLILVTIFAGVNLDNKCDITFIFYTFKQVPVFMTVIVSFAIGAILMLPFTLGRRRKRAQKPVVQNQQQPKEESKTLFDFKIKRDATPEKIENGKAKPEKSKKEKKSWFGKKGKKAENSDSAKKDASTESANPVSDTTPSSDDDSTGAPV